MEEFMAFLVDQWMLSAAFVAISAMLVWSFISAAVQGFKALRPADAILVMNKDDAVMLDVRSENEFLSGHIINSINIPLTYLGKRIEELDKHKESNIVVVCQSGARSKQACSQLKKAGFERVSVLSGGIMAWQHDKLPLNKKK